MITGGDRPGYHHWKPEPTSVCTSVRQPLNTQLDSCFLCRVLVSCLQSLLPLFPHISWPTQSIPPSSDHTTVVSLFISIQQKWACFRFSSFLGDFTKIQFGPTIHMLQQKEPPAHSLSLSLRSFLPYTELVFKSSQETCSLSCTSFVVSGKAEEAVTHLLRLKEMVVSIDLQETFLPWGHALQPQRWPLIFVLLQSVWLDCRPLFCDQYRHDVMFYTCAALCFLDIILTGR